MILQYILNLLFAADQLASTILGGHPDDTVSQRLGRAVLAGNTTAYPFARALDFIVWAVSGEEYHCFSSLHGSSSVKEIWNWGGQRSDVNVEE
jgi:hypothetical protein